MNISMWGITAFIISVLISAGTSFLTGFGLALIVYIVLFAGAMVSPRFPAWPFRWAWVVVALSLIVFHWDLFPLFAQKSVPWVVLALGSMNVGFEVLGVVAFFMFSRKFSCSICNLCKQI